MKAAIEQSVEHYAHLLPVVQVVVLQHVIAAIEYRTSWGLYQHACNNVSFLEWYASLPMHHLA